MASTEGEQLSPEGRKSGEVKGKELELEMMEENTSAATTSVKRKRTEGDGSHTKQQGKKQKHSGRVLHFPLLAMMIYFLLLQKAKAETAREQSPTKEKTKGKKKKHTTKKN